MLKEALQGQQVANPTVTNWGKRMDKLPSSVMAAQEDSYLFCNGTSREAEDCASNLPGFYPAVGKSPPHATGLQ